MENKIHTLVKVLEQMEDDLEFTCFYTWEEIQKSHHFCPAWDFDGYYYEIQYDNLDELQVLRWRPRAPSNTEGDVLSNEEVEELIKDLVEFWADNTLKREKGVKQMIVIDGWQHFLEGDIVTSDFTEDVIYSTRTERLTREDIIKKYSYMLTEKDIKNL